MDQKERKGRILKQIKQTQRKAYPSLPESKAFHVHSPDAFLSDIDDSALFFAEKFVENKGKFSYCENQKELSKALRTLFEEHKWEKVFCIDPELQNILTKSKLVYDLDYSKIMEQSTTITSCDFLVARFGSIISSSSSVLGRKIIAHPDTHIVIAYTSQIVNELEDAIGRIKEKYAGRLPAQITMISGPSRTADIEKTLVMGAHGPKDLYLFLVNDK